MLLLDAGNSRCKWACIENGAWTHRGVSDNAGWTELQRSFESLPPPMRIIVSNVGGDAMEQRLRTICSRWAVPIEFIIAERTLCGVVNSYENPARLGSDRWAALIAAWQRYQGASLVVNCGTATTVDAIADTGEFLGGLIMPGVTLMQQSLMHNTAQLQDSGGCLQDFPHNTADAIHSGVVRATLGAIEQQYALLQVASAGKKIPCLLSGGAAEQIVSSLGMKVDHVDSLVLEGLKIIGEASA